MTITNVRAVISPVGKKIDPGWCMKSMPLQDAPYAWIHPKIDPVVLIKNVFAIENGCVSLRLENCQIHEEFYNHKKSLEVLNGQGKPQDTEGFKNIVDLNEFGATQPKCLFLNVHDIGKKIRPYSVYEWMCRLNETK